MTPTAPSGPAFGQADLTNCERELIHLAGSVQAHGLLLVVREPELRIVQASANLREMLGVDAQSLLNQPAAELGGDLKDAIQRVRAEGGDLSQPTPMSCRLHAHGQTRVFEGMVHRVAAPTGPGGTLLVVELEPLVPGPQSAATVDHPVAALRELLNAAVQRVSAASTVAVLADNLVRCLREMLGYDRVMVYKFDSEGHGVILAEARDPRLESLLGLHYPATDIPQRARELYLRNRLRVLVDVHSAAAPLVPRLLPGSGDELDMSMCHLRSMSPLHLQYLKNMGVTATLVVSLVREGRLWGLIACHHDSPRNIRFAQRCAADLLAEVAATRIAAIENYAHAQVAMQVQRLEQRLVEATSTEGDWRLALFRNPRSVLQPFDASGAALCHEGEWLTAGETPSTAELRALVRWIDTQAFDGLFSCTSVERVNPALASLTPSASGVLAVRLSASKADCLMWFRKEQLLTVTWGGNPSKVTVGNDPLELSPRRSFAAWSEIVRGTALPWSSSETALARAFGASLVDIIVQVNAVRLLIAEHQLAHIRASVGSSNEPIVIVDAGGRALFANDAFSALSKHPPGSPVAGSIDGLASLFAEPQALIRLLALLANERQPWRGQLALARPDGPPLPVELRAEVVPARDGSVLGFFLIFADLTDTWRAAKARRQLEQSLVRDIDDKPAAEDRHGARDGGVQDALMSAILANASLAAMDIADGSDPPSVVPLLEELEASTRRASLLYSRMQRFGD